MKRIAVIGGGLAGLVSSYLLGKEGYEVVLFEEKKYPFHRVCGEYISNETIPFLKRVGLYPEELEPAPIRQFHLTSVSGRSLHMSLDLGGFGISRYRYDHWLVQKNHSMGVKMIQDRVLMSMYSPDGFELTTRNSGDHSFDLVIGAFGKRSMLDKALDRGFVERRSPYIGVKYHIQTDQVADDVIALHNFKHGYCGVSRIEDGKYNLCYLSHRSNLKSTGSIEQMEHEVLHANPYLKELFVNSSFLFDKPEVINEISFESKEPVKDHVLMTGDAAGMITPLCGNGMAMAIHSAKLLAALIISNVSQGFDRAKLEADYTRIWKDHFSTRLWAGRKIQQLFGAPFLSELAVASGKTIPPIARYLMAKTHGDPFS